MINPYDILGISPSADEEEVKAAYKKKAMKIFEGKETDSTTEKMSEIDEAYDYIIKNIRASSAASTISKDKSRVISEYADVRRLISEGRLDDAEEILDGVGKLSRNIEWNYLKAYILYKRGWLDEAASYASKAYEQDPYNAEYSDLYNELNGSKTGFDGGYFPGLLSGCGCMSLICCDLCCGCFRRR